MYEFGLRTFAALKKKTRRQRKKKEEEEDCTELGSQLCAVCLLFACPSMNVNENEYLMLYCCTKTVMHLLIS